MLDINIQNFKFGLDSRRSELTSQPGTLQTCQDAHINTGAEVEKRPGFFPLTTAGRLDSWYGLEVGLDGLYVFGDPTGWANVNLGNGMTLRNQTVQPLADPIVGVVDSSNFQGTRMALTAGATLGNYYLSQGSTVLRVDSGSGTYNWSPPTRIFAGAGTKAGGRVIVGRQAAIGTPFIDGSDVNNPMIFQGNAAPADAFTIPANSYQPTADSIFAFATYQGLIAAFGRYNIATWNLTGASSNFSQVQRLQNIGTNARFSVQSIGELDVFFLHSSGIRSLRVRDSSNNGFIVDLGSPIDAIIAPIVQQLSQDQLNTYFNPLYPVAGTVCSVIEPSTNRYWVYIPDPSDDPTLGRIYVFSYFPNIKILAWSTYTCCYYSGGVRKWFSPRKMISYNGFVFIRGYDQSSGKDMLFGFGYDGVHLAPQYDAVPATIELPWLDAKTPTSLKTAQGIDIAMLGAWKIQAGMAPRQQTNAQLNTIYNPAAGLGTARQDSTFDIGQLAMTAQGTHFKMLAQTTGSTAAKLSSMVFKYTAAPKR